MPKKPEPNAPVPVQRWVKPQALEPGQWRWQLRNQYLELGVKGDLPGLRRLLKERPEALNQRGQHGRTLLWEAARRGHTAAVAWLLACGAAVDPTGCYNNETLVQITPYVAAVHYRRPDVARLLLDHGAQLDIFRAAFLGLAEQVLRAIDAAPELGKQEDPYDLTYDVPLLAFAIAGGHAALAAELIKRGAVVNVYSAQLLHMAARLERRDLVALLLAHGADARAATSGSFVESNDLDLLRDLLAAGAPVTTTAENGFPPLVYVSRGDKGEHPEKVALLLEHGADVNATGRRGRTALHYAAAAGHAQVAALLLAHGADKTIKDDEGQTPRALARAMGKTMKGL